MRDSTPPLGPGSTGWRRSLLQPTRTVSAPKPRAPASTPTFANTAPASAPTPVTWPCFPSSTSTR